MDSCPLECNSVNYDISTSSSDYPSYDEYLRLLNITNLSSNLPNGNATSITELKQSLYNINVYFDDLQYTQISDQPQYTTTSLVANIGGLLGVFLGMSFLSIVDFLQIVAEIALIFLEKEQFSRNKVKPEPAILK